MCQFSRRSVGSVSFETKQNTGGAILPKVFCQKISAILGHSAILGPPFVLRAYIAGSFLPNCVGVLPKKFGDIAPPVSNLRKIINLKLFRIPKFYYLFITQNIDISGQCSISG
jgi:hypothetical protein